MAQWYANPDSTDREADVLAMMPPSLCYYMLLCSSL